MDAIQLGHEAAQTEALHPVRFIEFRSNHIIEIGDFIVFSNEGCWESFNWRVTIPTMSLTSKSKFRVCLDSCHDSTEHGSRYYMNFV